ncbi:MAG: hypothetical protein Q9206_001464 [Seirophora lacunosa]
MVAPSFGLSIIEVCKFIADGKPRSSVWRARDKFAGLYRSISPSKELVHPVDDPNLFPPPPVPDSIISASQSFLRWAWILPPRTTICRFPRNSPVYPSNSSIRSSTMKANPSSRHLHKSRDSFLLRWFFSWQISRFEDNPDHEAAARAHCDVFTVAEVLECDFELIAAGARVGVEGRGGVVGEVFKLYFVVNGRFCHLCVVGWLWMGVLNG